MRFPNCEPIPICNTNHLKTMKINHLLSIALCGSALFVTACDDEKPKTTPEAPATESPAAPAATAPAATAAETPAAPAAAPAAAAPKMKLGSITSYDDAIAAYTKKDSKLADVLTKIKNGEADINAAYSGSHTPISSAAAKLNRDLVAFLLSKGADINGQDPNAKNPTVTPLNAAVDNGASEEFVKELVAAGADVNLPSYSDQTTPFITAASTHNIPMMKLLVSLGADTKAVTKEGRNALFFGLRLNGISIGKPDYKVMMDYLIDECGLDVNHKDKDGRTPLLWVITFLSVDEMQYFISKGADPLAKTNRQEGLVHFAAHTGMPEKALEQLKALESYQLDFNNGDNVKDMTPLYNLISGNAKCTASLPLLDYLITHGTRTDVVWGTCKYPIIYVAAGNNIADSPALLQYLIDKGIGDVNEPVESSGTTPLMNVRKPCMVEVLIKAGADPKATNKKGETAYQILSKRDAKLKEALEAAGVTE